MNRETVTVHGSKAGNYTLLTRISPAYYQTRTKMDGDGRPYVICRDYATAENGTNWLVYDSRGRLVSHHFTLRDARESL